MIKKKIILGHPVVALCEAFRSVMGVWLLEEDIGVTPDEYEVCRGFVAPPVQAQLLFLRIQMILNFPEEDELRYAYSPSLHYIAYVSGVTPRPCLLYTSDAADE